MNAETALRADRAGEAPHILLVEDSETQALQLRRMLEGEGFTVSRAATAEAALEGLNGPLPALVIADYHLPGMNGDELVRRIRLNVRARALPVLMLTDAEGSAHGGDLERQGLESGADAYAPKSAGRELILLRLRALLRRNVGEAAAMPDAPGTAFRRARLLLVDDSPTHRLWLSSLLTGDGDSVEAVSSAEAEAAASRSGDPWDGVLVNLAGLGPEGLELCRSLDAIRAQGPVGGFRIVALEGARAAPAAAFEAGADDVLPAEAGAEAIRLRVRALVRRNLLREENRRIEDAMREQLREVERARAEAASAEARAALTGALERANSELETANRALRDTQGKLVQAAKMASLGELVAGIAHEINNPLAFILAHQGTVSRLLAQVAPRVAQDPEAKRAVEKATVRAEAMTLGLRRIQDLVQNLRKFSRLDEAGTQEVDVPEAISTVLVLLTHKLSGRIVVDRDFTAPRILRCSPALLNQVVMNIIGNAADAIAETGRIRVATRTEDGNYVIEICDTGPGVPEAIRARIFEPFFTTKPVGSGTGLGLSIAYAVVESHRGSIVVDDAVGGGARFTIRVPLESHVPTEDAV
ncbi:ATP-binding protein [Roseomonas xinghualingensis]|uniref:ATP-binding protein n=1 Tax=Roseomonas xinghualingensis TaxID=2986475 RepID=UPI0021F196BF|nr:ATP-binding protein [Roseomonas sp. SXEYE001]MCV4208791.1 ATP-binding protein [Roseomonas sp. SXEYE001]